MERRRISSVGQQTQAPDRHHQLSGSKWLEQSDGRFVGERVVRTPRRRVGSQQHNRTLRSLPYPSNGRHGVFPTWIYVEQDHVRIRLLLLLGGQHFVGPSVNNG